MLIWESNKNVLWISFYVAAVANNLHPKIKGNG